MSGAALPAPGQDLRCGHNTAHAHNTDLGHASGSDCCC